MEEALPYYFEDDFKQAPEWEAYTDYYEGDIIRLANKTYEVLVNHQSSDTFTHCKCREVKGDKERIGE